MAVRRGRPAKASKTTVVRHSKVVVQDAGVVAQVRVLTVRFEQLKETLFRDAVETICEMGAVLDEGARLLRRRYGEWLEDGLGISRSAANNYRRVFALREADAELFVRGKEIGVSKMIQLGRVQPGARRKVLRAKVGERGVAEMTDAEFAEVAAPYRARTRPVSGNMKAHGLHMKIVAMLERLKEAEGYPAIESADVRVRLRADLAELAKMARALRGQI
jgi:hypothetical protein